jgi:Cu2+-exporting ATPase
MICDAGLGSFYLRSDRTTPTVTESADSRYTEADLSQHIVSEGNLCRIDILVSGITCPSCVWLLERMLVRVPGVEYVSLSYSGGIASLPWDRCSLGYSRLCRLAYSPRPTRQINRKRKHGATGMTCCSVSVQRFF